MSTISVVQYQNTNKMGNILQQSQSGNTTFILRKPPHQQDILLTNTKKKHKVGEKTSNPPPVAVARRNARERNRVKQVNNGFATLRQHIPNSIAAAFESSSGRGGNKKLSKVETLRMAVEYIRSLEDLLAGDDSDNIHPNISSSSTSSSTPSSPNINTANTNIYTYSNNLEDDDLSIHSQSPHQTYTTRNYQIITNYYDDSENLEPLTDIDLGNQDLSLLNSSLSPEMYSDDSLSPIADRQQFIPVFGHNEDVKLRMSPELMTEIKTEPPVLSLDNDNDLPTDSKENMIQVMAWWEQQQVRS